MCWVKRGEKQVWGKFQLELKLMFRNTWDFLATLCVSEACLVGAEEPPGLKFTRQGEGSRHGWLDPTLVEYSLWTLSCGLELESRGLLD